VDLDSVGEELYGLLPEEFTPARAAHVRAARSAGDRELAAAVAALRRPTIGAWLANQLARERTKELEELFKLGKDMRAAQEGGDGPALRRLSAPRHEMVTALASDAKALARTRHQAVSENSSRELESTLEAAVADAEAADALRAGRLTVGLTYSGFGPLGSTAPSRPTTPPSAPRAAATEGKARRASPASEKAVDAREARAQAERSRRESARAQAQVALARAQDAAKATGEDVRQAQAERDQRRDRVRKVERQLKEARESLREADQRLAEATRLDKSARAKVSRAIAERDEAEASR
jgi:DNA repair exonuclease SbcCD ATPase subunit